MSEDSAGKGQESFVNVFAAVETASLCDKMSFLFVCF